jgi:iron complex transport system substrate-binding protein
MRSKRIIAFSLFIAMLRAAEPQRIVSLSPDLTEMIYAVGALNRVVAVSDYESYPPEAMKLPKLGGLLNPNLEKLTAMRPDLVILNDGQAPFLEEKLKDLGLHILRTSNKSLAEVYSSIVAIGRATGNEAQANRVAAATRQSVESVARKTDRLPKVRVVLIVDRTPGTLRDLYTATGGSFLAEVVEAAGGQILVPPTKRGYAKLGKEDILALNPDMILDFIHGPKSRFAGDPLEAWQSMPELKAVRTKQVHGVKEDFVPHASQRVALTAELFAHLLHPEAK